MTIYVGYLSSNYTFHAYSIGHLQTAVEHIQTVIVYRFLFMSCLQFFIRMYSENIKYLILFILLTFCNTSLTVVIAAHKTSGPR